MASLTSDDLDALGQTEGSSEDLLATVGKVADEWDDVLKREFS